MRYTHLVLALGLLCATGAADAGEALAGRWKMVVLAFGDDEFFIVDIAKKDGDLAADLVNAQRFLADAKIAKFAVNKDQVTLTIDAGGDPVAFHGVQAEDRVLGGIRFRGSVYPARLEKTDQAIARLGDQSLIRSIFAARQQAGDSVQPLTAVIQANKGNPVLYHAYENLLGMAAKAKLSSDDVKKYIGQWLDEARPYGPLWLAECQSKALQALQGQERYAAVVMDLAQQAEKGLGEEASLDARAQIAGALAWAAGVAGNADIAKAAQARRDAIEAKLDEKYTKEVPPFQPDKFAGRQNPQQNRVVLMELFTGAQCPPCVGPDVAFDALLRTYKSSELIALQYHLHIPGPDPLTNRATLARAKYYGVSSTPTPFFNGKSEAQGGGGMNAAQAKYQEFRKVIEGMIEGTAGAAIKLDAKQMGDAIVLDAAASVKEGDSSRLRLRLVIAEESIRYVGSNKIRFHHHVVRSMPGGPEGVAFDNGSSSLQLKLKLDDIRKDLDDYLDEFAATRSFPRPRPSIMLDNLLVVAFVQDDATKEVLHAVSVPLH